MKSHEEAKEVEEEFGEMRRLKSGRQFMFQAPKAKSKPIRDTKPPSPQQHSIASSLTSLSTSAGLQDEYAMVSKVLRVMLFTK
jgi:hypothetical protein